MTRIVRIQGGHFDVQQVCYFTAPAKEAFASRGQDSVIAQQSYHRALEARHPAPLFQVILGTHAFDKGGSWMPRFVQGQPCDKKDRVLVWVLEEKQTDVNIALAMYRACSKGQAEHVVLCTNDSDLEPALRAIREDFPHVHTGVISPVPPHAGARRFSKSLAAHAHWVRRHITDEELGAAQLPAQVATRKKPVRKPAHW